MLNKITEIIYLVAALLFVAFLVALFSHICFGFDEYLWKTLHLRYSFWGYFDYVYRCCSFRYSTHFYLYLTFAFCNSDYYRIVVFISQAATVMVTVLSIYSVCKHVFKVVFQYSASRRELWISAVIFSAALYFFTSQIVETYTYTSSFFSYYMPVAFLCAGVSIILRLQTKWYHWIVFVIASFSLGGSAENVSLSSLMMMGVYFGIKMLSLRFNVKRIWSDQQLRKLLIFMIVTSAFALVAYTAPGAADRAVLEKTNYLLKANTQFSPVKLDVFLSKYFHYSNVFGLLLLTWFFYLGSRIKTEARKQARNIMIWGLVFFITSLTVHLLITEVIFDSYGYLRIWSPVNFAMCLMLVLILLYAGTFVRANYLRYAVMIPGSVAVVFLAAYFARHYPKMEHFSKAYFDRRLEVKEACKTHPADSIITKGLPEPDILYFDKFYRFPEDSLSTFFCNFNEIPCKKVYVK